MKMMQLRIDVYKAANIVPLDNDIFGKPKSSDPYIIFNFGSIISKTRVVKNNLNPGNGSIS